ncbi:MAG: hypothetical protein NTY76_03690 [Candidatus Omnitrophica bacterium]|nr:hypothetical protein [Candidatus Omnitrophota bacterium]
MIKKKSLILTLISSIVICLVLVVNLAGYLIYLEMKDDELTKTYKMGLQKINAKVYSKHIEIARLGASFNVTGPLSGEAVLEGIIRNDGYRDITDMLIKVKFLDKDGAALYEVAFHPMEPSLGSYGVFAPARLQEILHPAGGPVPISHLSDSSASVIRPESSLPFKKILTNCPEEILSELKANTGSPGGKGRWTGKFDYEILSVNF